MPEKVFSLRAFGRRLGGSPDAVSQGVGTGRLVHAVRRNARGEPQIVDLELGRKEWRANAAKPTRGRRGQNGVVSLTEAQRLLTLERLRAARLDRDLRLGSLVKK